MRTSSEADNARLSALLDAALDRGVIDAVQRDRLRSLALEVGVATDVEPREHRDAPTPSREARRGFNAITVAYSAGALLVVFALGWFLVDRWTSLGPAGVLGVSLLYAAVFAAVGVRLGRRGFTTAGGLAIVLATLMTPVWTWALLRLTGEWPDPAAWDTALSRYEPYMATRLIVLDLATIGVALVAVSRARLFVVGASLAAAFVALLLHVGQALGDPRLSWYVGRYYQCVVACITLAVAYAIERHQRAGEDHAFWFYLAGVVMLFVGYVQVWSSIGKWRHALPLVALALASASLYLRRRTLLVAGGVAVFGYLAYLALDVFRRVVALPLAFATLGLGVIVATVWMQRRFPTLVARVNRDEGSGRRALPAGPIAVLGPVAIAITAMVFSVSDAREATVQRDWRVSFYRQRGRNQQRAEKRAATAVIPPVRTPADTAATAARR